jgi:hypothetical protein
MCLILFGCIDEVKGERIEEVASNREKYLKLYGQLTTVKRDKDISPGYILDFENIVSDKYKYIELTFTVKYCYHSTYKKTIVYKFDSNSMQVQSLNSNRKIRVEEALPVTKRYYVFSDPSEIADAPWGDDQEYLEIKINSLLIQKK